MEELACQAMRPEASDADTTLQHDRAHAAFGGEAKAFCQTPVLRHFIYDLQ
jgi:hypothetical protein